MKSPNKIDTNTQLIWIKRVIFLWHSQNISTLSACSKLWKKILFEINWTFKQQSGSLQNNFVFFSSDVDMAIGFMNECQTSGLLNMNTNLLISSVVSLSAVHTNAFSTTIVWLRFDNFFFKPYVLDSSSIWMCQILNVCFYFSTAPACRKTTTNIWYSKYDKSKSMSCRGHYLVRPEVTRTIN